MYFKDTESNERPVGMSYEKLPNGQAFVMIRKNIRSESRTCEDDFRKGKRDNKA